jgi:glycerate kinase
MSKTVVVIAPDSFKGSLSAVEVADAIATGIRRTGLPLVPVTVPMADGGEGTVEAVLSATGGRRRVVRAEGPLGDPVDAAYGILPDGRTAVIETAAASGLPLVPADRRNPLLASSYGTGQLIRDALDQGCRRLMIGVGGSATNDGGMGMAQALGVRFLDEEGRELGRGGAELERIAAIDCGGLDPRLAEAEIRVLCDVTNPLCGPEGASAVFGPQKGATPEMVERLDRGLARYAERIAVFLGRRVADVPGAGAAGGLAAGLLAFGRAELVPGVRVIMELVGLEQKVRGAALVITGEGRTDGQSARGKVPSGVGAVAAKCGVPAVCLSGGIGEGADLLYAHGITAMFSIANRPLSLDEAMRDAARLLAEAAENAVRLFWHGMRGSK